MATQTLLFDIHEPEIPPNFARLDVGDCELAWEGSRGQLWQGDSTEWLCALPSQSVDLIIADPPYNIAKAEWDEFDGDEHYLRWSLGWIEEAARVLKPQGTLYIFGFSEILADLKRPAMQFFQGCRWLIWNYRNKANLGSDWGRSHESILHLRKSAVTKINVDDVRIPYGAHTLKYPSHPQAQSSSYGNGNGRDNWTPNPRGAKPKDVLEVPTTCNGMGEKTPHPTQKPEELIRKLVLASSNADDVILDPFSGAGTTAVVAQQLGRCFLACEREAQYNEWAAARLSAVRQMSVEGWLDFDRKTPYDARVFDEFVGAFNFSN